MGVPPVKRRAAGTYVQISRDEFEDWLKSTGYKWERDKSKAGIYRVLLSPNVGIQISSSIGSRDDAMGRGRASVKMRLVSLKTGHTLNKKAQGKSHFKRTKGWKKTWKNGLDAFKSAYMKAKSFYDKLAQIEDRGSYQEKWLRVIEKKDGWENSDFLRKQHEALEDGKILSDKVEQALLRSEPSKGSSPGRGRVDEKLVNLARQAWVAAKRAGRQRDLDFLTSLGKRFAQGTTEADLSPGQLKWWNDIKRRYRLRAASKASAKKIASEYITLDLVDASGGVETRTLPLSSLKYFDMFKGSQILQGPNKGMDLLEAVEKGMFTQAAASRVASRYLGKS